jgi:hypothetical protein
VTLGQNLGIVAGYGAGDNSWLFTATLPLAVRSDGVSEQLVFEPPYGSASVVLPFSQVAAFTSLRITPKTWQISQLDYE